MQAATVRSGAWRDMACIAPEVSQTNLTKVTDYSGSALLPGTLTHTVAWKLRVCSAMASSQFCLQSQQKDRVQHSRQHHHKVEAVQQQQDIGLRL